MADNRSQQSRVKELSELLGENQIVVTAFVGRMAQKLRLAPALITEALIGLVQDLISKRDGGG